MAGKRKDVYLVCGGKYHDFDFARLELLKLLAEHDVVRVKVANDYSDVEAMCQADLNVFTMFMYSDFIITYYCLIYINIRKSKKGDFLQPPLTKLTPLRLIFNLNLF